MIAVMNTLKSPEDVGVRDVKELNIEHLCFYSTGLLCASICACFAHRLYTGKPGIKWFDVYTQESVVSVTQPTSSSQTYFLTLTNIKVLKMETGV